MTKEEAIKWLNELKFYLDQHYPFGMFYEAINVALDELKGGVE